VVTEDGAAEHGPDRDGGSSAGVAPPTLHASGTAIGVTIAIVPQEVPVENAMNADATSTTTGSSVGVTKFSAMFVT